MEKITVGGFFMEKIHDKRVKGIALLFLILIILLAAKTAYIQIFCHERFESEASMQQEMAIEGLDTRGMILDRNLMPLTGGVKEYYYIIPESLKNKRLEEITQAMGAKQIAKDGSKYLVYKTGIFDYENGKILENDYEAYIFSTAARYSDNQLAAHFIGYLNEDEKVGVSGIEKMYQKTLCSDNSNLMIRVDAGGNILRGFSPVIETDCCNDKGNGVMNSRSVVTSLDRRLQYMCEKSLSEHTTSGAAVVSRCDTGEILAWASVPSFDPDDIESYLNRGDCLINKVSQGAYAPGSVFKVVTAAAAMENNICDDKKTFECKGTVTVNGITLGCSNAPPEGHGEIDMNEAMAVSCNCYFAQLAEEIGSENIVMQAEKMGFGRTVLDGFPEESIGNIPDVSEVGSWDVTNLAIGQGEILATPLQINNMISLIASGGKLIPARIVTGDEEHKNKQQPRQILKPETAHSIENMLASVMDMGTGSADWQLPVWGKTGTAEAGAGGEEKNCWFTGYCSIGTEKYAVTVFAQNGISGSATAMPVFKEITEFLKKASENK